MKTIKCNIVNELIIKNSTFITELIKCDNIGEVENILKSIKDKYKGANHYCYAYIIGNIKRCNDDGEPSGTAGMPILNVLEKKELNYILCVAIRYFGGIKLGAGGLVRAYSNSVSNALKKANVINLIKGYELTIAVNYCDVKKIDYLLKDTTIIQKKFENNIIYIFKISIDNYKKIEKQISDFKIIEQKNIFISD